MFIHINRYRRSAQIFHDYRLGWFHMVSFKMFNASIFYVIQRLRCAWSWCPTYKITALLNRWHTFDLAHCYLTNRAQYVEINGTCSNLLSIGKDVPQGSILGPLLFMIFINDIHRSSKEFKFIIYADDTTLFSSISSFITDSNRSMANASETINSEINKVTDWLTANN